MPLMAVYASTAVATGSSIPSDPPPPPTGVEFSISDVDGTFIGLGAGDDTIHVYNCTGDIISMGQGDNTVTMAGEGKNIFFMENGNDFYDGWSALGGQAVFLGGGTDFAQGGFGNDLLMGEDGDDALYGGAGNDTLSGGAGNDILDGESGKNRLDGGAGNDFMHVHGGDTAVGGAGSDTFDFSAFGGEHGIAKVDYHASDGDTFIWSYEPPGTEITVHDHLMAIRNLAYGIDEVIQSTGDAFNPYGSYSFFVGDVFGDKG